MCVEAVAYEHAVAALAPREAFFVRRVHTYTHVHTRMCRWNGSFRGGAAAFKMTSVCGHLLSIDFPPAYNSWDR